MSDTLITACVSSLIVGFVALASAALTNHANTKRLKLQFQNEADSRRSETLRGRGEELYVLTEKWLTALFGNYLNLATVMQGQLDYNHALDIQIADGKSNSFEFSRIELLIDIYFPSTRAAYDAVIAGRDRIASIAAAHKQAYKAGDIDGRKVGKPFFEAQQITEQAGVTLKAEIIKSLRAI